MIQLVFSDHSHVGTDGIIASKVAIMKGADVIERHFTILSAGETRDGPVSIDPLQLKELSEFSKLSYEEQLEDISKIYPNWKKLIGNSNRNLSKEELLNRDYYRGRFASPRMNSFDGNQMIYNWEEINYE